MNFDLRKTEIFRATKLETLPFFKFANPLKKIFLFLFVISLFFVGLSGLGIFSFITALRILFLFLTFYIIFWEISLFFVSKVKNPDLPVGLEQIVAGLPTGIEDYNLAEFLSFDSAKIVLGTIKFCKKRRISEIGPMVLLYSALEESEQIKYIFLRLGLNSSILQQNFKNYLEKLKRDDAFAEIFTEEFNETIVEALKAAQQRGHQRIEATDILVGISKTDFFNQILIEANLRTEDFENITLWFDYLEKKIKERKRFWGQENLAAHGSLAKDWASGYTITLDQYSIDWRNIVSRWNFKAIIGHEKQLEQVQMALAGSGVNNVLIVGEPGTGRESIIQGLARRIYLGKSLPELNYFRVVELDMTSLLSQITNSEEVENTLDRIFQEVITAGNIILAIKEFHNYVGVESVQVGTIDISNIIGKYLKVNEFRLVAITDYAGLHTRIEKNPSLAGMFVKVEVSEISELETIRILQNSAVELEQKYKVFVTYPTIREIINLSARYIPDVPFPKKAIDLLEDVVVYVARSVKEKIVLPEHVSKVISVKTEVPVGRIEFKEKEVLLNLEKLIHKRIINQEEAVKQISIAMRRARAGIASKKRPMGNFLFIGPTGVGKTETSKALAEIYFGAEQKMIRLDMSEFQSISDIPRLIGGSGQEGILTTPVRENPFSVLLLDEIEKAHYSILNLFLQVLDEGHLTDGQGRKVIFTNTIIICTSNAGAELIFEGVEKEEKLDKQKLLDFYFEKGIFKPEFINRFDAVVLFNPLTKENLLDIAQLMLDSLKKNLKEKNINFIITEELKTKIVGLSYKPAFGAREMRRVIQDNIENVVAQALLSDELEKGESFEISSEDFIIKKVEK